MNDIRANCWSDLNCFCITCDEINVDKSFMLDGQSEQKPTTNTPSFFCKVVEQKYLTMYQCQNLTIISI